jgi:ParB family chromosome partitioning protein
MSNIAFPNIQIKPVAAEITSPARDQWALWISEALQKTVAGYIETGRRLIDAKANLDHGEWLPLLADVRLSATTAEKFMVIARNQSITNSANLPNLPASYTTLYALTKLPPDEFERRIIDGTIHPDMRGVDVHVKGTLGTGLDEWWTPPEYIERARAVLGDIDLDPATCTEAQGIVRATRYLTKIDDGRRHEWHGRVWLNPPYAKSNIDGFIDKLIAEYRAGRTTAAILLTHAYTSTAWFHRAEAVAELICFTRGRIRFLRHGDRQEDPTEGQAFFYFGRDGSVFRDVFSEIGFVR